MRINSNYFNSNNTLKRCVNYLTRPNLGSARGLGILLALFIFNIEVVRADDDSIGTLLKDLQEFFTSSSSSTGSSSCFGQRKYCEGDDYCRSECGQKYICNSLNRCVGMLSASCRDDIDCHSETDDDDGQDSSSSGYICNKALNFCTMRSNTTPCGRDKDCLEGYSCQFGACISNSPQGEGSKCKEHEDCRAPAICDPNSKKCQVVQCTAKKDCPGGGYQCINQRCERCRYSTESCSDSGSNMGCCKHEQLECQQNVCRKRDLGKKIGDTCSSIGAGNPFITSSQCGGTLECENSICKGSYNTKCLGNEDCLSTLGCIRNECKDCKRQADGGCLLGLGAYCETDAECESNKCDDYDKVCVKNGEVPCKDNSDCKDDKLASPNGAEIEPICKDGMCQLCTLAGNDVRGDFQCCGDANPHNGVCLLDGGGSCKDDKECKSKKCEGGKCVGSADGEGQAATVCGDRCCNGMETGISCPQDCPQRFPIAEGCVPNLPVSSIDYAFCAEQCERSMRCNGFLVITNRSSTEIVSCRCDNPCQLGRICYETNCLARQSVCEKVCIYSNGRQSFSDGFSVIECSCGGVTSSGVINVIPVPAEACKSQRACRLASTSVCKSGFSCCDSNIHSYQKGEGPCVDQEVIVQLEEGARQ